MRLADSQYYLAIQSWASLVCLCSSPGLTKALLRKYVGMWVFSWDFLRKVLISTTVWLSLPFWFSLVMQLGFISKEFTTDKELLHFFTRCKYPFCQHCRWFACNWVTPASAVYGELCSWFVGPIFLYVLCSSSVFGCASSRLRLLLGTQFTFCSVDAAAVRGTPSSFVAATIDASVMICNKKLAVLQSVCSLNEWCSWSANIKYQLSFWRWKSSFVYPLLIETWSSLPLISNTLPSCEAILYQPQTELCHRPAHTDCDLLSSLQIHPIQYQCPLLLFQKMWSLIEDAALSETGVFSFPFHSKLSISAGEQQTCKH